MVNDRSRFASARLKAFVGKGETGKGIPETGISFVWIKENETDPADDAAAVAPKRDTDDTKRHIRRARASRIRGGGAPARRLGRLRQGHLHRHGGDDAFGAGRRSGRRPDRLHAPRRDVRQTVPDAGFLPDFRAVPLGRDRPRLAHLSRPQGRAFRLFLRAVGDDPVRLQGAVVRRRNELAPCRLPVSGILHRAVRHAVVHLSAADLLRRHKTVTRESRRWRSGSWPRRWR